VWGVGGCVTSLWPGLHLSNQTICLLALCGAGCRRGGSGACKGGLSAWSPRSLPALTFTPQPPVLRLVLRVLWIILPLQTPWRQPASLPCVCPRCLWWFSVHPLQGLCSHSRLRPHTQKLRGAALSPVPRASGHQSPADNILLFLLLASGVFYSFCCTQLCSFLNVVF